MGVYSRFSKVLEADGTPMSVRSALQIINQELDIFFNEQDGELDRDSRFCVDLYSRTLQCMKFGDADTLGGPRTPLLRSWVTRRAIAQKALLFAGRDEYP
jgi:putative DNA methylase